MEPSEKISTHVDLEVSCFEIPNYSAFKWRNLPSGDYWIFHYIPHNNCVQDWKIRTRAPSSGWKKMYDDLKGPKYFIIILIVYLHKFEVSHTARSLI